MSKVAGARDAVTGSLEAAPIGPSVIPRATPLVVAQSILGSNAQGRAHDRDGAEFRRRSQQSVACLVDPRVSAPDRRPHRDPQQRRRTGAARCPSRARRLIATQPFSVQNIAPHRGRLDVAQQQDLRDAPAARRAGLLALTTRDIHRQRGKEKHMSRAAVCASCRFVAALAAQPLRRRRNRRSRRTCRPTPRGRPACARAPKPRAAGMKLDGRAICRWAARSTRRRHGRPTSSASSAARAASSTRRTGRSATAKGRATACCSRWRQTTATFDRMWSWTRANLMVRDDQLIAWRWTPGQRPPITDMNNATDGDILVAWALAEAAELWADVSYRAAGRRIAVEIARKTVMFKTSKGALLLPACRVSAPTERPDGRSSISPITCSPRSRDCRSSRRRSTGTG